MYVTKLCVLLLLSVCLPLSIEAVRAHMQASAWRGDRKRELPCGVVTRIEDHRENNGDAISQIRDNILHTRNRHLRNHQNRHLRKHQNRVRAWQGWVRRGAQ